MCLPRRSSHPGGHSQSSELEREGEGACTGTGEEDRRAGDGRGSTSETKESMQITSDFNAGMAGEEARLSVENAEKDAAGQYNPVVWLAEQTGRGTRTKCVSKMTPKRGDQKKDKREWKRF